MATSVNKLKTLTITEVNSTRQCSNPEMSHHHLSPPPPNFWFLRSAVSSIYLCSTLLCIGDHVCFNGSDTSWSHTRHLTSPRVRVKCQGSSRNGLGRKSGLVSHELVEHCLGSNPPLRIASPFSWPTRRLVYITNGQFGTFTVYRESTTLPTYKVNSLQDSIAACAVQTTAYYTGMTPGVLLPVKCKFFKLT